MENSDSVSISNTIYSLPSQGGCGGESVGCESVSTGESVSLPLYYREISYPGDTLYYTAHEGPSYGVAGDPIPYTIHGDSLLTLLLILSFVVLTVSVAQSRRFIGRQLKDFFYNVYLPTLKKFDGKVYNIRFIKALREQLPNNLWYVKELDTFYKTIEIQFRANRWSYTDYESLQMKCITTNEGRLSYEETFKHENTLRLLDNFITYTKEYQESIDKWDECEETYNQLNDLINKWKELPTELRYNVDTTYFKIYLS